MRVAIAYNAVPDAGAPDEQDVLVQLRAVAAALGRLGHRVCEMPVTLDLSALKSRLEDYRAEVVFNLVESLGGSGRLIHLVPALLDAIGIPYTGAPSNSIHLTSHKAMAKERMLAFGLPTPAWIGPFPAELPRAGNATGKERHLTAVRDDFSGWWMIKSLWEHASVGLDESRFQLCETAAAAERAMRSRAAEMGGSCFAESFVDGREFNLSLIGDKGAVQVLPPAEILFEGFAPGRPKIVGYRAKWQTESYEYRHTPRRFDFHRRDAPLLDSLSLLATECWRVFGLRGYARVDFRVDPGAKPWILEINANPCLSPDAGFAAALAAAGIGYTAAVARILGDIPGSPVEFAGSRRPPG